MNTSDKAHVDNFLRSISRWETAYKDAVFSYIAVKKGDALSLICGRIFLGSNLKGTFPQESFEAISITAGFLKLSDIGLSYDELINQIAEKKRITLPYAELIISNETEDLNAYFNGFHMDNILIGKRVSYLRISGGSTINFMRQPDLDWELKAAEIPFDSINDLKSEYWLGSNTSENVNIEVFAHNVVEMDSESILKNNLAEPKIILATPLDRTKCKIAYRVVANGAVLSRGSIDSTALEWKEDAKTQYGSTTMEIPVGSIMHCVAIYAGEAQHQYWLADLANLPNSRRALLEENDNGLKALRDYLFNEVKPRKTARDFEVGVALLMWMFGFSVAQPGATQRTTDSVDIIATSNNGYILLIECTIGLLKAENKLATLIARTETSKRRMQNGHRHLKVLPIIVTAMTREEVKPDLKYAMEHDVLVITQENLYQMLDQTVAAPNSDLFIEQLINSQSSAQAQ